MVIKRDYPLLADGLERVEYTSDKGLMIKKVGTDEVYSNAIELLDTIVEYEETNFLVEDTATEEAYQNALIELGVDLNA
jgi:hypothetical protein